MTSYVLSIVDVTKTGHGEGARGTGKKRGAEKKRGEGEIDKWEASRELQVKFSVLTRPRPCGIPARKTEMAH